MIIIRIKDEDVDLARGIISAAYDGACCTPDDCRVQMDMLTQLEEGNLEHE